MADETPVKTAPAARYSQEKKEDGTIVVKINVPWSDVEKTREKVLEELVKQVQLPGFRKGAAPKKLAEERLNPESVKEEVLKKILADEYIAAVKELALKPIVSPHVHVEQFTDGTNLEFTAETCEEPQVNLKNYKDEVKKIGPGPKIITSSKQGKEEEKEDEGKKLDEILAIVIKTAEVKIPKVLVERETNRLLSQLLDELKRLGVTLDQYLASRGKKTEELRAEYDERAEKDLKLEFVLRKIADDEKITVEAPDIETAINSIKDEKERAQIAQNPYVVAAIIRQQKTLDFLAKLN